LVATEIGDFFFLAGNFVVVPTFVAGFEIAFVASVVLVAGRTTFLEVAFLAVAGDGSVVLLADWVDWVTGTCFNDAATFI
jgi:hypothetical protein